MCRKHRGLLDVPGGAIYEDDLVHVGHGVIEDGEDTAYLGVLFVEPRRHAPELADLTEPEAARIGVIAARASVALREILGAERVYAFALGHHVDHLHLWLLPRYPGTPDDIVGMRVLRWPGAPRGGPKEIETLCNALRTTLATPASATGP